MEAAMASSTLEEWDLWYPKAGATGIPFARGRLDPAEVVLVHAAPPLLSVDVRAGGRLIASGKDLPATDETPIARLTRRGATIEREGLWPGGAFSGGRGLPPGGEVGGLLRGGGPEAHGEWRWRIELYNRRDG
nr:MAG: hypothetical protein DIU80_06335 [Chloroflexota bacterium]